MRLGARKIYSSLVALVLSKRTTVAEPGLFTISWQAEAIHTERLLTLLRIRTTPRTTRGLVLGRSNLSTAFLASFIALETAADGRAEIERPSRATSQPIEIPRVNTTASLAILTASPDSRRIHSFTKRACQPMMRSIRGSTSIGGPGARMELRCSLNIYLRDGRDVESWLGANYIGQAL